MESFRRAPVTLAAIAAMTIFLSGCIALDAVGGLALTTAGDVMASSFDGHESDNANQLD
jgi:hypothetical protein